MTPQDKEKAVALLTGKLQNHQQELTDIEPRLAFYLNGLVEHPDVHNAYEILGAIRFMRLLETYEKDIDTFRDVVLKYEGVWEKPQDGGPWHHVEGGLKHPGTSGPTHYRLQPFQVFVLASMFLLRAWINTGNEAGSRELLPTECEKDSPH